MVTEYIWMGNIGGGIGLQLFNLDDTDRKILELLQGDGRLSYAEIARHTHLSRVAVRDRVKSLTDRGIIQRFTVQVLGDLVGYSVQVYLRLRVLPGQYEAVLVRLQEQENLTQIFTLTGEDAIHGMALFRGLSDLNLFLRETLSKMPGIVQVETQLVLDCLKNNNCIIWKKA